MQKSRARVQKSRARVKNVERELKKAVADVPYKPTVAYKGHPRLSFSSRSTFLTRALLF